MRAQCDAQAAKLAPQFPSSNSASGFPLDYSAALSSIGYRPVVPITASQFADDELRNSWIRDKNMKVLQFWSDLHKETPIGMKTQAGRQQDLVDIEHLRMRVDGNDGS